MKKPSDSNLEPPEIQWRNAGLGLYVDVLARKSKDIAAIVFGLPELQEEVYNNAVGLISDVAAILDRLCADILEKGRIVEYAARLSASAEEWSRVHCSGRVKKDPKVTGTDADLEALYNSCAEGLLAGSSEKEGFEYYQTCVRYLLSAAGIRLILASLFSKKLYFASAASKSIASKFATPAVLSELDLDSLTDHARLICRTFAPEEWSRYLSLLPLRALIAKGCSAAHDFAADKLSRDRFLLMAAIEMSDMAVDVVQGRSAIQAGDDDSVASLCATWAQKELAQENVCTEPPLSLVAGYMDWNRLVPRSCVKICRYMLHPSFRRWLYEVLLTSARGVK